MTRAERVWSFGMLRLKLLECDRLVFCEVREHVLKQKRVSIRQDESTVIKTVWLRPRILHGILPQGHSDRGRANGSSEVRAFAWLTEVGDEQVKRSRDKVVVSRWGLSCT